MALSPIVNGALLAYTIAGVTPAPPDGAASAVGAPARAVTAMAPIPASFSGEMREREWMDMESPIEFECGRL